MKFVVKVILRLKPKCLFKHMLIAVKAGWTKVVGNNNYGPYAHSAAEKQWVGYDDVNSIAKKAEYDKLSYLEQNHNQYFRFVSK